MATLIEQLYSQNHWDDIDGVQTIWNFTFSGGYISPSHIKAYYIDADDDRVDISVTEEMFIGEFQLEVNPPVPATAQRFVIYRQTPKDDTLVNFEDGSRVTGANLNRIAKQAVFAAAEALDQVVAGQVDGLFEQIADVDVVATAAAAAAASAASAAAAAQSTANTAQSGVTSNAAAIVVLQAFTSKYPKPWDAPYNAAGNGTTDDTAAFAAFEAVVSGRDVDLADKTFAVSAVPAGNTYTNGNFRLSKSTNINGVADPYTFDARPNHSFDHGAGINILRDCSAGLANRNYLLTQVIGLQSFAFDEKGAKIYTLHVDGDPEVSYISEYAMAGGTAARSATAVSNSDAQIGHQGLGMEYLDSGSVKLWSAVRYDATNYPNGHRQALRFSFAGNAADVTSKEVYTLFDSSFSYTGNNSLPTVSHCGRYLVAVGRKTSRDFWVRVFDIQALVTGGAGDYSSKWLWQFQLDRAAISDDTAGDFRPLQGLACDGSSIYTVSGNSHLTGKRIDRYSMDGRLEQTNNNVTVGITEATSEGTFFEPEGIAFYRPNNSAPAALVVCIVSAGGGAHKNRLWVMGYQSTISEERETLKANRWTPTPTAVTNVAAITAFSSHYIRVGNEIHFGGRVNADPTAAGFCEARLSLPVASNFSSLTDAAGALNMIGVTGTTTTVDTGGIEGDTTNDELLLKWICTDTANRSFYFSGTYEVK